MRIAPTTKALAAELGTTRRTVSSWLKREDCPGRTAAGGFNVRKWREWMQTSGVGARTLSATSDPQLEALRREKLKLQTEKIALEAAAVSLQNARLRGELWPEQDVSRVVAASWSAMIGQLRQTKHRIAAQLCGLDSGSAARVLDADLRQTLKEFSIPEGLAKHPFFGKVRARIEELQAALDREARTP